MKALREFRFENRAFWRNPAAAFFTFMFPLMFLFLFPTIFGSGDIPGPSGETITGETFYVPAIGVFAIITATYTNNAMTLLFAREEGVLKRKRGTPLRTRDYMLGRIMHSMFITFLLVAITVTVGKLFFGVAIPSETLPAFIVTVLTGAFAFCALGIAISGVLPNVEAGPPVVNASILPLLFISNVFIPTADAPEWLTTVAKVFPVYHFAEATLISFSPFTEGNGFEWNNLAIVAVWGVAGILIAFKTFAWEPKRK